ncbi:DUF4870 domain-containing protein [Microbacterium sp. MYb66]|uniref:DUF4870 domain-containing protein n=1 Tax=Microbacterium sp. MYb66 TaxID=1848692 RepID=UPI000CFE8ED6|nr:DUF4870 domain-containing protein [Microbacterium sp. MYb66]
MTAPESRQPGEFTPPPPPPAPPAAPPVPPASQPPAPAPPAPQVSAPAPQDVPHGYVVPPAYPAAPAAPQQGYAAPAQPPGHAAPAYPGQGYPAPSPPGQGYPEQSYAPATPARGLLPWVLGFLILIPFPFVGGLASGIAMAASGGSARRAGGPAAENARSALNWGLTYLMVSTLLLLLHFVLLFALTSQTPATGFFPLGIPITLYFAVSVLHLVLVIVGTVRVSSGGVMRVPFAIPFVRA